MSKANLSAARIVSIFEAIEAGQEARSVHQQAEWKEPQAPQDRVGQVKVVMQVEEQHGEGVGLRLVED